MTDNSSSHPEDLSADVGDPLLLQRVPFGVFDEVCHRAGPAELHHQLHTQKQRNCTDYHTFLHLLIVQDFKIRKQLMKELLIYLHFNYSLSF